MQLAKLLKEHPERYDFREEILKFQTGDAIDRYHIYKAVALAERDGSLDNVAYVAAWAIKSLHSVLLPGGEADRCPLFQEIAARLWAGKHLEHCVRGRGGFSGDTMNSGFTTVSQWLGARGIRPAGGPFSNLKVLALYLDGRFRSAVKSCPQLEIERFLSACYTMGNFIPVPSPFQDRGLEPSRDYWDLALACIYNDYQREHPEKRIKMSDGREYSLEWLLKKRRGAEKCRTWLETFPSWDSFVEENFLQAFVQESGEPLPLWENHFTRPVLPESQEDFRQFFTNASQRIEARGRDMADKLREVVGE